MNIKIIALIAVLGFGLSACKKDLVDATKNDLVDITELDGFDHVISTGVSFVFFHASWCSNCEEQRPAVEEVTNDEEYDLVQFIEVEYEDSKEIVDEYDVPGFPTMYIFKDGVKVEEFIGKGNSAQQFRDALDKHL